VGLAAEVVSTVRIAIVGAGGVGGYYGGLLARAGNEVALIARGAHLEAIRAAGLCVESVHGDFAVRPYLATDDPAEVGPVDLVLFTVKTYDLEAAGRAAQPLVGPETVVLPLENGLDAPEQLGALLGAEHVLPGVTHVSSTVAAPGAIRQTSPLRRITFGEAGGSATPRAERVRDVLAGSGIEAVLTADVQAALWAKFTFIAAVSGVCAAGRLPMGRVLATPETRALYVEALREIEAVARATGVPVAETVVADTLRLSEGFPATTKPSLLVDLEAGRRLELEALNGAVVRRGEALGVATPVHRALYALLLPWATWRR
jgi:2-dehydropantoate 2-reductase